MEPAVPHCADQKSAAEETQYHIEILSYNYLCWSSQWTINMDLRKQTAQTDWRHFKMSA